MHVSKSHFSPIWIWIVLIYKIWETFRNKLEKHSVDKNCFELSLSIWINCSNDLKNFANSRPSASNFKSFSRSLEQFFLTVGQNNFGNKIPFLFETDFLPFFWTGKNWELKKGLGNFTLENYFTPLRIKYEIQWSIPFEI